MHGFYHGEATVYSVLMESVSEEFLMQASSLVTPLLTLVYKKQLTAFDVDDSKHIVPGARDSLYRSQLSLAGYSSFCYALVIHSEIPRGCNDS